MEMRYRLELLTRDGFVYCSTARSFRSAWLASERQTNRDAQCEMRILESLREEQQSLDEACWHVLAEIVGGQITRWNGQPVSSALGGHEPAGTQLAGTRA